MTEFDKVRNYYHQFDEWGRLEIPGGQLEFLRAMNVLAQYLKPNSRILDLGGGPGRYTVALAQAGHLVWLADLSPTLLNVAREQIKANGVERQVQSVDEVNAIDLGIYSEEMFDAILIFGPYYHLVEENERIQATREIGRTLKNGGLVFVTFMPWLGVLSGLISFAAEKPEEMTVDIWQSAFEKQSFRSLAPQGFQESYFATSGEMKALFDSVGIRCLEITSLRGIGFEKEQALWRIKETAPELFEKVMIALEKTATDPAVVSLGGFAVYIGQKQVV